MSLEPDLKNQTALVTGASGGIGRAIALRLAELGASVYLVARRLERLQDVAKEITSRGSTSVIQAIDLTRDESVEGLVRHLKTQTDGLDVLVLSSGVINHGSIAESQISNLDRQYSANLRAPYLLIQSLLPMLKQRRGQIVFINSSAGMKAPAARSGQYAITQFGFRALADALRDEVNPDGVRVLSIYPGRTATDRIATLFEGEGRDYRPELLMQPEDIATLVGHVLVLPRTAEVTDISMRPMIKSY